MSFDLRTHSEINVSVLCSILVCISCSVFLCYLLITHSFPHLLPPWKTEVISVLAYLFMITFSPHIVTTLLITGSRIPFSKPLVGPLVHKLYSNALIYRFSPGKMFGYLQHCYSRLHLQENWFVLRLPVLSHHTPSWSARNSTGVKWW